MKKFAMPIALILAIAFTICSLIFLLGASSGDVELGKKSEKKIRESLLKITPLGTNVDDVVAAVEKKEEWEIFYVSCNSKSYYYSYWKTIDFKGDRKVESIEGRIAAIQTCCLPAGNNVNVYWNFDEDEKLIDIVVEKQFVGI